MNPKDKIIQSTKKPWPTKEAMEQIYDLKLWGGKTFDFFSGEGSHLPELVRPYLDAIITFLISFEDPLVVCDLGCGDFNIGKELVKYTKTYVAVDIVEGLIARNKEKFKDQKLQFHCLDLAVDALPSGDCVILRQVLQHVSNAEILNILDKLTAYKYVIITEHKPEGNFEPNKDIISGQGIRLKKQSGINLLAAPFHFKVKEETQMLSLRLQDGQGIIVTTLYTMY